MVLSAYAVMHKKFCRQDINCKGVFQMKKLVLFLVLAVVAAGGIFAQEEVEGKPPLKSFSVGARLGGNIPWYSAGSGPLKDNSMSEPEGSFGFNFAVQGAYNVSKVFSVQLELIYHNDEIKSSKSENYLFTTVNTEWTGKLNSLIIPVLAKYQFLEIKSFGIGALAGFYYPLPLGEGESVITQTGSPTTTTEDDVKPSFGLMIGVTGEKEFDFGFLFADIRFAFDLGNNTFKSTNKDQEIKRTLAMFSVGYMYKF
jgi:hypothetical protein